MTSTTIEQAMAMMGVKTRRELAEKLAVSRSAVSQWARRRNGMLPPLRSMQVRQLPPS
jgi:transcriptional regulator with XRE-family HTH domain